MSATLTNGVADFAQLTAWIQPGGGGLGMGSVESNVFAPALLGGVDFAGSTLDAIALRLDALTLDEPTEGRVDPLRAARDREPGRHDLQPRGLAQRRAAQRQPERRQALGGPLRGALRAEAGGRRRRAAWPQEI